MPRGRPPLLTLAKQDRVGELIFLAYTDKQIALLTGVSYKTIAKARTGEMFPHIAKKALEFEEPFRRKMYSEFCGGTAWMLERRYPSQFAKPEVQLTFQQNHFTQNNLSIHITNSEARAIEVAAEPVRESVKAMYARYKPALGNGNDNGGRA